MKQLSTIFGEHKAMLLDSLTQEVTERGGVIKVQMLCGGKDGIGFDRQTIIDRIYLGKSSLWDETMVLCIMAHDKKYPDQRIETCVSELSLDVVQSICFACDEYLKRKGGGDE